MSLAFAASAALAQGTKAPPGGKTAAPGGGKSPSSQPAAKKPPPPAQPPRCDPGQPQNTNNQGTCGNGPPATPGSRNNG